jgi:hypothetical protein
MLLGLGISLLSPLPAWAVIVITVQQEGADVVIRGSGSADTASLTSDDGTASDFTNVLTDVQLYAGLAAFGDGEVRLWSGLLGPLLIGSDPTVAAIPETSSNGDLFGIISAGALGTSQLVLPTAYLSGTRLSGTSRFANYTLAELGLSPGTLFWTWGTGENADSLALQIGSAPVPAPLPVAGGVVAWRTARALRRRKRLADDCMGCPAPGPAR